METLAPVGYSSTINNPNDFELIAVMELLSFEDISFTSINYYLSTLFLSDEPPPSILTSSTGNRRLLINYHGPVDDLEPHDVVLIFPHKTQSAPLSPTEKTRRMNEFKRHLIHVLIIDRIISSPMKIEGNTLDSNREPPISIHEKSYKSCLSISDNWKPGALNHVKQVINRYQHTCCANYHE
ncbi:hypothetical protein [Lonsdalea britannica]|uniref:hypothetical protein n=1 Tax=Lonsdalea britannica TaxID=1082704 RepID=UPI00111BD504|nr:hypothetical protein [Lonsdalea britannica]